MINLFIGLLKENKLLRAKPTVIESLRELEYELWGIEQSFLNSLNQEIKADIIVCSRKSCHTLIGEWTSASSLSNKKKQQIERYTSLTAQELVDNASIPVEFTSSCSTLLVIQPQALLSFQGLINDECRHKLMVSSFEGIEKNGYSVNYNDGNFCDDTLTKIFKEGIQVKHIPKGYISVSMDETKSREFFSAVVSQLLFFFLQEVDEFTDEDICREMFGVWDVIGVQTKKSLKRAVHVVLKKISNKNYSKTWLRRVKPNWKITTPKGRDILTFANKIRKDVEIFLSEEFENEEIDEES